MTGAAIAQQITDALNDGKSVVLNTRDTFGGKKSGTDGLKLLSGDMIHGDHGYNVIGPPGSKVTLWNPWGKDDANATPTTNGAQITVDPSELPTVTEGLNILDP